MAERKGNRWRHWHPGWKLLVFTGVFLPVLLGLGYWQLERAAQKQQQLTRWQAESRQMSWQQQAEAGLQEGLKVVLEGRYTGTSWLLDNRTRSGYPGYEVLTLFEPREGPPVVINRGWIQAAQRRQQLPEFATPRQVVQLQGRISDYPEPPLLAETDSQPQGWPRRVQALPRQRVVVQEPAVARQIVRLSGPEQPGAFRADWELDRMGPQTHYGYALQWFSLALVLTLLTVIAGFRNTGAKS